MKKFIPYILIFIIAILVLMLIRKPDIDRFTKQQFWDSISIANKNIKISDLKHDNIKLSTYTDSLQSLITYNDSIHSKQISTIKDKTQKELEEIRAEYIIPGSDSSELLQEVTLYKELDFCQGQRELAQTVIKKQQIKINNLDDIISQYQSKEDIYKRMVEDSDKLVISVEKEYKKKLRKTKILSGVIIAGSLGLVILVGL